MGYLDIASGLSVGVWLERVELVVINFCVILKTQGCKEISEKVGPGSGEQRCCLGNNTKERMISRETKRHESCKERVSH